jgi:hypothetical protein
MYPEYRKKLKTMTIPPPRIFLDKFSREHEGAGQSKQSGGEPPK